MKELKYQIKMLSDWHTGSGLDSGTDANSLVIKDDDNLPYVPGKTVKGLIRDAVVDMVEVGQAPETSLTSIFEEKPSENKSTFFSNAIVPASEASEIKANNLSGFLYRNTTSTAIGGNGVAKPGSLRVMEITAPLNLHGSVSNLSDEDYQLLEKAIKLVRRLGVNRNRGLGRCQFFIPQNELS